MSNRKVLVEVSTAAAASLIATLSAYPIEVINTKLQTSKEDDNGGSCKPDTNSVLSKSTKLRSIFRGLHLRLAQVIVQSVSFFYVYSNVKMSHERHTTRKNMKNQQIAKYNPSITAKLMLTTISAMITVVVSLPLESLATKRQLKKDNDVEGVELKGQHSNSQYNSDGSFSTVDSTEGSETESYSCGSQDETEQEQEEIGTIFRPKKSKEVVRIPKLQRNHSGHEVIYEIELPIFKCRSELRNSILKEKIQSVMKLWTGLFPSLLLTSNTSINFTIFDTLKVVLLRQKKRQNKPPKLSMLEAFVLGMIAKFAAIIVTYPLIRTKMIMLVAKRKEQIENGDSDNENNSVIGILRKMYDKGGVSELYKGCGLTLFLTVFKNSMFMMARDKICSI